MFLLILELWTSNVRRAWYDERPGRDHHRDREGLGLSRPPTCS